MGVEMLGGKGLSIAKRMIAAGVILASLFFFVGLFFVALCSSQPAEEHRGLSGVSVKLECNGSCAYVIVHNNRSGTVLVESVAFTYRRGEEELRRIAATNVLVDPGEAKKIEVRFPKGAEPLQILVKVKEEPGGFLAWYYLFEREGGEWRLTAPWLPLPG